MNGGVLGVLFKRGSENKSFPAKGEEHGQKEVEVWL